MEKLNDFGDRLDHLIRVVLKSNAHEFGMKTGISPGNISKAVNADLSGRKVKLGQEKLEAIAQKYPQVDMNWLITGVGEPIKTTKVTDDEVKQHPLFRALSERLEQIENLLRPYLINEKLGKPNGNRQTALANAIVRKSVMHYNQLLNVS